MMTRAAAAVVSSLVVVGAWSQAHADRHREDRPMQLEIGLNTRHFTAADEHVAFRSTGDPEPSLAGGDALSTSIRFTGKTRYDTFLGIEAEAGALLGHPGSNLAAAYAVGGARHDVGRGQLAVEIVGGRRWVRYDLGSMEQDPGAWIAEPRVRADLWLGPHATLGGAIGATLSDRSVWMAGIYVGVNSSAFGRWH